MMSEQVMNINAIPSYLTTTLRADRVRVRAAGGEVRIIPLSESPETDKFLAVKHAAVETEEKMRRLYELCGSGADLKMTVDSFLAMTHDDKELSE